MELRDKHIVLGLTGGIACYKSAELCRLLIKQGASVQVVMSAAAERFITPLTMQIFTLAMHSVTGNAVGVIAKRQKRGHIAVSD